MWPSSSGLAIIEVKEMKEFKGKKPNSYVVTMYVDAECPGDIDTVLGHTFDEAGEMGVNIKNWIVDDDENPELHT